MSRKFRRKGRIGKDKRVPLSKKQTLLKKRRKELIQAMDKIGSDSDLLDELLGNCFPKKIEELGYRNIDLAGRLEIELYWQACVFRQFSTKLSEFISRKVSLARVCALADYPKSLEILDAIETDFGVSLWLLEARLTILSKSRGLAAQKEYVNIINREDATSSLAKILIHYFSIRLEPSLLPMSFQGILDDDLESSEWDVPILVKQYFRYKLDPFGKNLNYDLFGLILHESRFSLIDQYETWVKVIQLAGVNGSKDTTIRAVSRCLPLVQDVIADRRLDLLGYCFGVSAYNPDSLSENLTELIEIYTNGCYSESINLSKRILEEEPHVFEASEIYVRSVIYSRGKLMMFSENTCVGQMQKRMKSVLEMDSDSEKSVVELLRMAISESPMHWAPQLYNFVKREYSYDDRSGSRKMDAYCEFSAQFKNPRLFMSLRDLNGPRFAENWKPALNHEYLASVGNPLISNSEELKTLGLPNDRKSRFHASILESSHEHEEAIKVYQELADSDLPTVRIEAIQGIIRCALSKSNFKLALSTAVDAYLDQPAIWAKLPLGLLKNSLLANHSETIRQLIEAPILMLMVQKHFGIDDTLSCSNICEDFLALNGYEKPSELQKVHRDEKTVFFLRYGCVPDVLDNFIVFGSTEEILRERLNVCRNLVEIDSVNQREHLNEVQAINTRLATSAARRVVEEARISVNVAALKVAMAKELEEGYRRYQDLEGADLYSGIAEEIVMSLGEENQIVRFYLPQSERDGLLKKLFAKVRDGFVSSNEYGLDTCLSIEVRHGTLAGHLRPVFEKEFLITLKDTGGEGYLKNKIWEERMSDQSGRVVEKVLKELDGLSAFVDEIIKETIDTKIQIKTESNDKDGGLFIFLATSRQLRRLKELVFERDSFDQFFESVIEILWEMTEDSMELCKVYIDREMRTRLLAKMDATEKSVMSLVSGSVATEFGDALAHTKIELENQLDKVKTWFAKASDGYLSDFQVSLPLGIAKETLDFVHQGKQLLMKTDEGLGRIRFKGEFLKPFSNIILNLVDNALKYGESDGERNVILTLEITKQADGVRLSFSNSVDVKADTRPVVVRQTQKEIKTFFRTRKIDIDRIKGEKHSGLLKIARILLFELSSSQAPEFLFRSQDQEFFAVLQISENCIVEE